MKSRQIPLDLAYPPALAASDFVIGAANSGAFAWIERWPEWPGHSLALFGPEGSGKSHLAQIWRARAQAIILEEPLAEGHDLGANLALESPSSWPERTLLHLLNQQRESGRHVLLLDREPPARWRTSLPDLRSRLSAVPAVELLAPDDQLLMAVMAKQFADRNQTVGDEALRYLALRIERSFAAASLIVHAIDRRALAERRPITQTLIRETLAAAEGPL